MRTLLCRDCRPPRLFGSRVALATHRRITHPKTRTLPKNVSSEVAKTRAHQEAARAAAATPLPRPGYKKRPENEARFGGNP